MGLLVLDLWIYGHSPGSKLEDVPGQERSKASLRASGATDNIFCVVPS